VRAFNHEGNEALAVEGVPQLVLQAGIGKHHGLEALQDGTRVGHEQR
jgi:hypothetical protein